MKNLITKEEKDRIDSICMKYLIKEYSINPDGSIDVIGNVNNLSESNLYELPLVFNKVSGSFYCKNNKLTTLKGSPITVGGNFACQENDLVSLVGGPKYVGGHYICDANNITSLEGAPEYIAGGLFCLNALLMSTYSGETDIGIDGIVNMDSYSNLPELFINNISHIKMILKYQRHFFIWNDDLTLNVENFNDLISEIEDGLK